jgi:hypothetical protein
MYHFTTKTDYVTYKYDWNQVKVTRLLNGSYSATIFVKDFEQPCCISGRTQHEWISNYKDFIAKHGGLDKGKMKKHLNRVNK